MRRTYQHWAKLRVPHISSSRTSNIRKVAKRNTQNLLLGMLQWTMVLEDYNLHFCKSVFVISVLSEHAVYSSSWIFVLRESK